MIKDKKETGIKIVIVGGCAKLIVKDYMPTNIYIIVPSINELLVPGFIDEEFMDSREWTEHWLKLNLNCNSDHKKEIFDVFNRAQNKFNLWTEHKELFWPDGLHANRLGHKILFDYLVDNLNLN